MPSFPHFGEIRIRRDESPIQFTVMECPGSAVWDSGSEVTTPMASGWGGADPDVMRFLSFRRRIGMTGIRVGTTDGGAGMTDGGAGANDDTGHDSGK